MAYSYNPGKKKKQSFWDDWGSSFESVFKVSERELVKPQLSYWDKRDLYDLLMRDIKKFVMEKQLQPYCNDLAQGQEAKFEADMEKIFPKYMLYDAYNINYTPTKDMTIAETDEDNKWLFDFLMNKATEYYMKAVTQDSPFNSYVYTSEIVRQLLLLYGQQNPQGPGQGDGEGKDGKGQSGMQKMLQKMLGSGQGNQQLDQAMQQAQQNATGRIENAEASGEASGELGSDKSMGSFSLGQLSEFMDYQEAIQHIQIDSGLVNSFIKTTLNLSKSYFSSRYKEYHVDLMEADGIDDLVGVENLHPALRAINLEEVLTHERQYHMKFDVYIDISGSMSSKIYSYDERGKSSQASVSGLDMAKITAIKLRNLGFVEDVYPFEGHLHPKLADNHAIALMQCQGGTSIDTVIRNIEKTNRPSVIITDMQDNISVYNANAYFIGILGATFEQFKGSSVGQKYVGEHQCVKYDNKNTFSIVT